MQAVLAEAGTGRQYRCFAYGALVFAEEAAPSIELACSRHSAVGTSGWSDAASSRDAAAVIEAVHDLLVAARQVGAEFRVVVCRKEDFHVWNRDVHRGFAVAADLVEQDLRKGETRGTRRPRPSITDAHVGQVFGVASLGLADQVTVDVRARGSLAACQAVFTLFVSAIASDTDAALGSADTKSRDSTAACESIAQLIGVDALRNDTWPTYRQSVPGTVRHNIWHFPEAFRSSPGVSQAIAISV
jgi:hypothetical protein